MNEDVTSQPSGPRYPVLDLGQALDRARQLWHYAKNDQVDKSRAANSWGYAESSSGLRMTIAALRHFGLIESVDGQRSGYFKLTDLALKILQEGTSVKGVAAVKKASLFPALYREVWDHWQGELPTSNGEIQKYLVNEKGFTDQTAESFTDVFKQSIAFVKLEPSDFITSAVAEPNSDSNKPVKQRREGGRQSPGRQPMEPSVIEDVLKVPEGKVVLQWPEPLSQESLTVVQSWLEVITRKAQLSVRKNS